MESKLSATARGDMRGRDVADHSFSYAQCSVRAGYEATVLRLQKSKQKMAVAETTPLAAITSELEDDINIPDARKVLGHSPRGV